MSITPEMEEILQYLDGKDNYALFAGFAAFLHTGVEPSPDIDIFVSSLNDLRKITEDFIEKGWMLQCADRFMSTVRKRDTTFDIIFSEPAEKALLPCKVAISFEDKELFSITPEALLLTKMDQITSLERSDEKTKRDRKVIHILRQKIDVKTLKKLLQNLEDSFWTEGYFQG